MTKVYIIRHAEAEGNLYRRAQGQYNSNITGRGFLQIEALRKRFEGIHIDAVYSSDLTRTQLTASAIYEPRNLPLNTDKRLREVEMGSWEDLTWGEIEWRWPQDLERFSNNQEDWHIPGCEDLFTLRRRMTAAISDIAEANDGKTIAIVSHGCAIRAFISGLVNGPEGGIGTVPHGDNTNVSVVEYENGEFNLVSLGDADHLGDELSTFAHQKWWKEKTALDNSNMRFEQYDSEKHGEIQNCCGSVKIAFARDKRAGYFAADLVKYADENAGCVDYVFMDPEYRCTGMSAQLLGEAISISRKAGLTRLITHVEPENTCAIHFFERFGFVRASGSEDYIALEKDITIRSKE